MAELEMTLEELLALPVSVDLTTAGRAFGLGRTKSFELAQAGEFPCRTIRVGVRWRVPRSAIFEALDIDPAEARLQIADSRQTVAPATPSRARRSHRGSNRVPAGDLAGDAA
jgi:hypothetical protein